MVLRTTRIASSCGIWFRTCMSKDAAQMKMRFKECKLPGDLIDAVVESCGCQTQNKIKNKFGAYKYRWYATNEVVAADTFFIKYMGKKHWILHLSCWHSRWSLCFVCAGEAATGKDVCAALRRWREVFGWYPGALYSDQGREFINQDVFEMCLDEGVRHVRTVADCHRSNGFIERGNRTLRNIIEKLTSVE